MNIDFDKLKKQLSIEEGRRKKVYMDSRGIPTIGIGRNLRDNGLSDDEIDFLFANDIDRVANQIQISLPWVLDLDEVRQRVFFDLVFNMGIGTVLDFHNTLALAKAGDWDGAAKALSKSKWHTQVGGRAITLENMLRTGKDHY